jgi:transposase
MKSRLASLPNDAESLKRIIADLMAKQDAELAQRDEAIVKRDEKIISLTRRADLLQEQLNLAIARRFAARSEKIPAGQMRFFDEAEGSVLTGPEADDGLEEAGIPVTPIAAHVRRKCGRRPLPAVLPRIDIVHELSEAERVCPHDGQVLSVIGEEVSEQLDIIPAKIQVLRHIRRKYACSCGQCVKTAPVPLQPIPKSLASPGLLAHIAVSKYQDALPLYRQEEILTRIGCDLPRATLASWMVKTGILIQPLINLLRDKLLGYDILALDETPVQVLKEPGKSAQSQSYLWVQRGGPPESPIILFDYDKSRSQDVPLRLLEGFTGILQTDGYSAYNAVVRAQGLIHAGCLAHCRRKFDEVIKAQGRQKKKGLAEEGLTQIQKLYAVEKAARGMTAEDRRRYRDQHARPLWATLRIWLETHRPGIPPQTALGKALAYLANEWDKLVVYLTDGRLEADNNRTENAIRPFCIGRRNWLFSDSIEGVKASANLYGLIETCKANNLEPYAYLRKIFTDLPKAQTIEDLEALLPTVIRPDQIAMALPVTLPQNKHEVTK